MTADFARIEEIFTAAVAKADPAERAAYLDEACAGDDELRQRVKDLLVADADSATFLPLPNDGTTAIFTPVSERPGSTIGRYKLLEQIGEGGFGVVFMAEQERPVRRRVALKIIKAGMDTKQVVARFEAERQALAMMDHPNIAKVFDAGATETGRPYFVMELVRGVPITTYCDEARLTTNERLALFQSVCSALQHAHQKGIIHRDLKPSNVLVTMHDDKAVPKVIDFGVAKATQGRLTERTLFTEFRAMIGTPNYMSPEQAHMSGLDVDTRSDIYSLGVLLYELLTGTTPIDSKKLGQATYDDLRRLICEVEPPRPSARLSALTDQQRTTLARERQCEPAQLVVSLRSEVDWIVMKCLEKDRSRRYQTANSLAQDLQRYLANEPVEACPPTRAYQLKKFVRRNKVGVFAGSAVVSALVVGLALAAMGFVQARHQARIATAEAAKATAISDLLLEALQSANPDKARGTDYTVRQLLDEISAGIKDQFKDKPEVEATLHATIGNSYRRLDKFDKAGPHLKAALDLRRRQFGSVSPEVADCIADYAWYLTELGELQRAEATAQEAIAIHRKLVLSDDLAVKVLEASAVATWTKPEKYRELEQVVEEIRGISVRNPGRYPQLATVLHWLAAVTNDPAKGEQLAREAVELHRKLHGEDHPETAYGITTLGDKLDGQHKLDEAEACYREGLAIFRKNYDDGQTPVVHTLHNLARVANAKKDQSSLDKLQDMAAAIASLDSGDWESWKWRGALQDELGQANSAVVAYTQAIQMNNADVELRIFRGRSYQKLGKLQLAEDDFSKAIELEPGGWRNWHARFQLYSRQGKLEKAQADLAMAIQLGAVVPHEVNALAWSLATALDPRVRNPQAAVELAEKAVAAAPNDGNLWNTLGVAQYRAGDWNATVKALMKSMELRNGGDAYDWLFLAMAHWQLGQKDKARQWFNKAVEWMDKNQPNNEELLRFHDEAAELLGVKDSRPTVDPVQQSVAPPPSRSRVS